MWLLNPAKPQPEIIGIQTIDLSDGKLAERQRVAVRAGSR